MDGKIVDGPGQRQGNTPLGVADASGSVWTVYRLGGGWEVGGGAFCVAGAAGSTDANNGQAAELHALGRDRRLRAEEVRGAAEPLQPHRRDLLLGGYQNSPNRVLPGAPRAACVTLRYNF